MCSETFSDCELFLGNWQSKEVFERLDLHCRSLNHSSGQVVKRFFSTS